LKILLVHNYYRSSSPSGENLVFEEERNNLVRHGDKVHEIICSSDSIKKQFFYGYFKVIFTVVWNQFSLNNAIKKIKSFRPDVIHAHNLFPLISPSLFYASSDNKKPIKIITLHNYRIFCAAGTLLRNKELCTLCLDKKSILPALAHSCYRNNLFFTLPLAFSIYIHRSINTWTNRVDGFIALTEFQKKMLIRGGLDKDKIHIKPNLISPLLLPLPWTARENKITFVGRLSEEKGVKVLLDAWINMGNEAPNLEIIGDGPLRVYLEQLTIKNNLTSKVFFLGLLNREEVSNKISTSNILIIPSICQEVFPLVILESFALGVPVIASRLDSLSDLVIENKTGIFFDLNDPLSLSKLIIELWMKKDFLKKLSENAFSLYTKKYSERKNYTQLMSIYNKIIKKNAFTKNKIF